MIWSDVYKKSIGLLGVTVTYIGVGKDKENKKSKHMNAEQARAYAAQQSKVLEGKEFERYESLIDAIRDTITDNPAKDYIVVEPVLSDRIKQRLIDDGYTVTYVSTGDNESGHQIGWHE